MLKGNADALIEAEMHPWDTAAPKVIIEEAGGRMTGWDGSGSWRAPATVASNGLLHRPLLAALRGR
jgi:fructose-1,6-bisphosphatase/inositol monophosphatase family enzyme